MSRHFWRACGCEPQSGLTLVELLVTIVIAGIAFAAIVPVFVQALTTSSQEKVRLAALNVAQDRIEKIRQLDFDQIAVTNLASETNTGTWKYASEFGPHWISDTGRVYSVYYSVDESLNTKQVYVTVDWTAPPRRVPNTFVYLPGYDATAKRGYGVTLSTIIYKQYGGAQVIDINTIPDSSEGVVTWNSATQGPLNMILQAVLNPADDNLTTADYAVFKGYGANDVLVLDQTVKPRDTASGLFQVTWSPKTGGSIDGTYRFEVTVYSTVHLPGNSYAEEFRLETGAPLAPEGLTRTAGDQLVMLAWSKSQTADVVSYEVWRRDVTAGGAFSRVVGNLTSTGHRDSLLTNDAHYQYYVVAVDWIGNPSVQSTTVDAYPKPPADVDAPPSPVLTNFPTPGKAFLTWPDVVDQLITGGTSGIDRYVVTRDDGQATSVASPKIPGQAVEFIQSITANHSYTVVALDAVGNQSAPAGSGPVTYTPLPPHNLVVSANVTVTFTVRDANNNVVDTYTGTSHTKSLSEGTYYVSAKKVNQTRGPVTVNLSADTTLTPFVF